MIDPAEHICQARYAQRTFAGTAGSIAEISVWTTHNATRTACENGTAANTNAGVPTASARAWHPSPPSVKMMHRPGPLADRQPIGRCNCRGYVFFGVAHRFGKPAVPRETGRDGGG